VIIINCEVNCIHLFKKRFAFTSSCL